MMQIPTTSARCFFCVAFGYIYLKYVNGEGPPFKITDIDEDSPLLPYLKELEPLSDYGFLGFCNSANQCHFNIQYTQCIGIFCVCLPGYKSSRFKCHKGRNLYEDCETNEQCIEEDENSLCAPMHPHSYTTCQCKRGYFNGPEGCIKAAALGAPCKFDIACTSADPASYCSESKKCFCNSGYFFDGVKCRPIRYINDQCNSTSECQAADEKTHCSFEQEKKLRPSCSCIPNYVFNMASLKCVSAINGKWQNCCHIVKSLLPAEWERLSKVVGILLGLAFLGSGCFLCARRNRTDPELGHCERGNSYGPNPQFRHSSNRYRRSSRCSRTSHSSFHNAEVSRYQCNANTDSNVENRAATNGPTVESSTNLDKPPPYEDVIKDREQAVRIFLNEDGQPSTTVILSNNHNSGEGTSHACSTCRSDTNTQITSSPRPQSV